MSWKLLHGDALVVLPTLAAETIDCVITDPPYNSRCRTSTQDAARSTRSKYVSSHAAHTFADFEGDNRDQRSFTYWLTLLLGESYRLARPGASGLVFCNWDQLPATSDALQAAGWTWRGIIPWRKTISRPYRDGFRRECEYVLWGSRGELSHHPTPVYLPGLVEGSQPRGDNRHHITQKPIAVMRQLSRICRQGGTVLDPCAGAGNTGIAALAEDRAFLGIEITEHYAGIARQRLAAFAAAPQTLSQ